MQGCSLVSEFGSDIADVDVGQRLVRLEVPDGNNEGMRAVGLVVDDQLGHDDGMVGSAAQRANPPLRSRQVWGVNDEGFVLGAPDGQRLKPAHVGAVAQLRLSIASHVFVVGRLFVEELLLLGSALVAESDLTGGLAGRSDVGVGGWYQEHALVQAIGRGLADQVGGTAEVILGPAVLDGQLAQFLCSCQ